jgi:hypothetical protein
MTFELDETKRFIGAPAELSLENYQED